MSTALEVLDDDGDVIDSTDLDPGCFLPAHAHDDAEISRLRGGVDDLRPQQILRLV